MPISIILELITRRTKPRRRRWRRWVFHPIREIKARFAPYGRLREVLHNARKQNLMHVRYASAAAMESPEFGRRLRTVLVLAVGLAALAGVAGLLVSFHLGTATGASVALCALVPAFAAMLVPVRR